VADKRNRLPGLHPVPGDLPPQLRLFLERLKERVEVYSGDRGDPNLRSATIADLESAGLGSSVVKNKFATLRGKNLTGSSTTTTGSSSEGREQSISDPLTFFQIRPEQVDNDIMILMYDKASGVYRRMDWDDFLSLLDDNDGGYSQQLLHAGL